MFFRIFVNKQQFCKPHSVHLWTPVITRTLFLSLYFFILIFWSIIHSQYSQDSCNFIKVVIAYSEFKECRWKCNLQNSHSIICDEMWVNITSGNVNSRLPVQWGVGYHFIYCFQTYLGFSNTSCERNKRSIVRIEEMQKIREWQNN